MGKPSPWDQQPDESPEAYARFLMYRNLGPARSLSKAYEFFLASAPAPKRPKSPKRSPKGVSGQWKDDCEKYQWGERAAAWDIDRLNEVGHAVVVKFIEILDRMLFKALAELDTPRMKPKNWQVLVETVTILSGFIPAETVAELRRARNAPLEREVVSDGTGESGATG